MAHNGPIGNSGFRNERARYASNRDDNVQISEHRQISQYSGSTFGPTVKRPANDEFDMTYQPAFKKEKVQAGCPHSDKMLLIEKSQPGYLSPNKCKEACAKSPKIPQSAIQRSGTSVSNFSTDSDIIQEIAGLPIDPKPSGSCPDSQIDAKSTSSSDVQSTKRSPYICDICKSIFQTKQKWKNHMDTHDSSKRYQCSAPGCGRSFTSQKYLDNHKADHFCRGLECIICGFVGKNKIDIKGHFKQCHLRDIERNSFTAEWNDVKDIFERNIQEILGGHPVQSPINYNLFESITANGNGEQFSPDGTNSTMSVPSFRESGALSGNGTANLTSPPPPLSTGTNSVSPSRNSCSSSFVQNPPPSSDFLEPQFPSVIEQPPQQFNSAMRLDQPLLTRSSPNDGSNYPSAAPNFPPQMQNAFDDNWEAQSYSQSNLPSTYNFPNSSYRQQNDDNVTTWMYQMPQEPQSHQYHATPNSASTQPPQATASMSYRYSNNNIVRQQSVNTLPSYQEESSFNCQQQVLPRNGYQQTQPNSNQYPRSYYQNYCQQEYYPQQNHPHLQTYHQQTPQRQKVMNTQARAQHPQMMRAADEISTSYPSMAQQQPQQIYNVGPQQQVVDQHFTTSWPYSNTEYYNHQNQPNAHSGDFQPTPPATTVPQFPPTEY